MTDLVSSGFIMGLLPAIFPQSLAPVKHRW
jgi:hypothetical protein